MGNGLNGAGDSAGPSELTSLWHARVKERQQSQLAQNPAIRVELPGGMPVMAVRANVLSLVEAGRIPDALTPFVLDLLKAGREEGHDAVTKLLTDGYSDWVRLMDAVWLTCVVEPTFVPDGALSDAAIPMRLVPVDDKVAFFNWSSGIDSHLDAFRQPGDAARASSDGEGVRNSSGGDVGSGPLPGTVTRLPVDASDVLRRKGGGKPPEADEAGAGAPAGASVEGIDVEREATLDVSAGHRDGAATGARGRRERRSNRGASAAAAA